MDFTSLLNDKIWDWSKSKALEGDKIYATNKLKLVLGSVENVAEKGENTSNQHVLFFSQCFHKSSFSKSLKVGIVL